MRYNISDLLDEYPAEDLELEGGTPLSPSRIRELTMSKIRNRTAKRKHFNPRILAVAALAAVLVVGAVASEVGQRWVVTEGIPEEQGDWLPDDVDTSKVIDTKIEVDPYPLDQEVQEEILANLGEPGEEYGERWNRPEFATVKEMEEHYGVKLLWFAPKRMFITGGGWASEGEYGRLRPEGGLAVNMHWSASSPAWAVNASFYAYLCTTGHSAEDAGGGAYLYPDDDTQFLEYEIEALGVPAQVMMKKEPTRMTLPSGETVDTEEEHVVVVVLFTKDDIGYMIHFSVDTYENMRRMSATGRDYTATRWAEVPKEAEVLDRVYELLETLHYND